MILRIKKHNMERIKGLEKIRNIKGIEKIRKIRKVGSLESLRGVDNTIREIV